MKDKDNIIYEASTMVTW